MHLEELVELIATEPEQVVKRAVRRIGLPESASTGEALALDDLLKRPAENEMVELRYKHVLGPGANPEAVTHWKARHTSWTLPSDLEAMIAKVDGIHLWADAQTGRSYLGLAPMAEWETARTKLFGKGASSDLLDDRFVALSYHQDGSSYVVLDVLSGVYYLMDSAGPDESCPIGSTIDELLDWLWKARILPGT